MTAALYSLDAYRTQSNVTESARLNTETEKAVVRIDNIGRSAPPDGQTTTAADIYPNLDEKSSTLSIALSLLKESAEILDEAARFVDGNEIMSADDAVQRFTILLPELFMCRSLGDSFGTIILALYHGIHNLKGMPTTASQTLEIRTAIKHLLSKPFTAYEDALKLTSKLELSGLAIDPPSLSIIGDLLVDQSLR